MNSTWRIWFMNIHQIWRELKRPFRIFKNLPFLWNCFIGLKCYWSIPISKLSEDTSFIMINLSPQNISGMFSLCWAISGYFPACTVIGNHPLKPYCSIRHKRSVWFNLEVDFPQFSSVAQLCPTLCDPMNRSTPDLRVHLQLPEFKQTHVHGVSDTIQPSHPL